MTLIDKLRALESFTLEPDQRFLAQMIIGVQDFAEELNVDIRNMTVAQIVKLMIVKKKFTNP